MYYLLINKTNLTEIFFKATKKPPFLRALINQNYLKQELIKSNIVFLSDLAINDP